MVETYFLQAPDVNRKEIYRYARCKEPTPEIEQLMEQCLQEALPVLSYRVCYEYLPLEIQDNRCIIDQSIIFESKDLVKNLQGCFKILLMAATIGVELDRLITRYGRIAPSKALFFQAIGAERIEACVDAFEEKEKLEKQILFRPRFSPGYGDLSLSHQQEIFQMLDCSNRIGLCLNKSLLMSPTKSVTAIAGVLTSDSTPFN